MNPDIGNQGKRFSKDYQPPRKSKSKGQKSRKFLSDIANQVVNGKLAVSKDIQELAANLGIDISHINLETLADIVQLQKAIKKADTTAYNAFKDRLRGKPAIMQEITVTKQTPIIVSDQEVKDAIDKA